MGSSPTRHTANLQLAGLLRRATRPRGTCDADVTGVIQDRYGADADPARMCEAWRPLRTWAAVHPRVLAGQH